jgi:flagellar protein FlaG
MTIDTIGNASPSRPADRSAAGSEATAVPGATRAPAAPVETAAAVKAASALPSEQQVNDALSKLNKTPQAQANNLEFSVDQDTKRTVVKVVDQTTKEVVRQFPTEQALAIAKALEEQQQGSTGLLINQTA